MIRASSLVSAVSPLVPMLGVLMLEPVYHWLGEQAEKQTNVLKDYDINNLYDSDARLQTYNVKHSEESYHMVRFLQCTVRVIQFNLELSAIAINLAGNIFLALSPQLGISLFLGLEIGRRVLVSYESDYVALKYPRYVTEVLQFAVSFKTVAPLISNPIANRLVDQTTHRIVNKAISHGVSKLFASVTCNVRTKVHKGDFNLHGLLSHTTGTLAKEVTVGIGKIVVDSIDTTIPFIPAYTYNIAGEVIKRTVWYNVFNETDSPNWYYTVGVVVVKPALKTAHSMGEGYTGDKLENYDSSLKGLEHFLGALIPRSGMNAVIKYKMKDFFERQSDIAIKEEDITSQVTVSSQSTEISLHKINSHEICERMKDSNCSPINDDVVVFVHMCQSKECADELSSVSWELFGATYGGAHTSIPWREAHTTVSTAIHSSADKISGIYCEVGKSILPSCLIENTYAPIWSGLVG